MHIISPYEWLHSQGRHERPQRSAGSEIISVDNFIWLLGFFFVQINNPFVQRRLLHLRVIIAHPPIRSCSLRVVFAYRGKKREIKNPCISTRVLMDTHINTPINISLLYNNMKIILNYQIFSGIFFAIAEMVIS